MHESGFLLRKCVPHDLITLKIIVKDSSLRQILKAFATSLYIEVVGIYYSSTTTKVVAVGIVTRYVGHLFCVAIGCGIIQPTSQSIKVNKGPKLGRLHIGLQIGPKIAAWYDFCRIKNLKFALHSCLPP